MASYRKYETRTRKPNPKTAALLVIDMQNHFSTTANPILTPIKTTIDLCRRANVPVIYTRHRHTSPSNDALMSEWWAGELLLEGTHGAELIPEVGPREGEAVVGKTSYGAFSGGTHLEERLREIGAEEVIVTGVTTNVCCETTAREAFGRGFRVFFSTDATASCELELHEASLMNLAFGFAYLVDCSRLQEAFFGSSL